MKNAICKWNPVDDVDGYNVYLKGPEFEENLILNGIDQHVNVGMQQFGLELYNFTVEFIFKNTVSDREVAFTGTVNEGPTDLLRCSLNLDETLSVHANKIVFQVRGEDDSNRVVATTDTYPQLSDGSKHTISFTKDENQNYHIYLDGVDLPLTTGPVGSDRDPTGFSSWDYPLTIGALNIRSDKQRFFDGHLYEARFWNLVRTPSQIDEFKEIELVGDEEGLYSLYKFDEGSGDTTQDYAGSNDGVLVGNEDDNMWFRDLTTATPGEDFKKQNQQLILDTEYVIEDIADGDYEAYSTAVRNGLESEPSNIEIFSTLPPVPDGYVGIFTPQDLQDIRLDLKNGVTDKKYYIANDLDFTGFGNFIPIDMDDDSSPLSPLTGELHGGGHVIKNLSTSTDEMPGSGRHGLMWRPGAGAYIHKFGMVDCYCKSLSGEYNGMVAATQGGDGSLFEDIYVLGGEVDTGGDRAGGFIGIINNGNTEFKNCYTAVNLVGGGSRVGGFKGWNSVSSGIYNSSCYRDTDVFSGSGSGSDVFQRTTLEMMQRSTFGLEWDFENVWDIVEGETRPFLRKGIV